MTFEVAAVRPAQLSPLRTQFLVVWALLLREMQSRFGRTLGGYAWALGEPLLHITFLLALYQILARRHLPNLDPAIFLILGIIPYFGFRNSVERCMGAMEGNRGILVYRQVSPADTVIARWCLETLIWTSVLGFFLLIAYAIGLRYSFDNVFVSLAALVLLQGLALGFGFIAAVAQVITGKAARVVSPLLRYFYFASVMFFPFPSLPQAFQDILWWNPMLQAIEIIRHGFLPAYSGSTMSFAYLGLCTLASLSLGLAIYFNFRQKVLAE